MSATVLHLTSGGLDIWRSSAARWQHLAQLANDGHAAVTRVITECAVTRCALLVDLAGERWLCEALPSVSRRDRHLLAGQRMQRHFPERVASHWHSSGQYGIYANLNPGLLRPWLDGIARTPARLHLLSSPALLAPLLLPRQNKSVKIVQLVFAEHLLTIAVHGRATLHAVRSARPAEELADALLAEATRMRQWLLVQYGHHTSEMTEVGVIGPDIAAIPAGLKDLHFRREREESALQACLTACSRASASYCYGERGLFREERLHRRLRLTRLGAMIAVGALLPLSVQQYREAGKLADEIQEVEQHRAAIASRTTRPAPPAHGDTALASALDLDARQRQPRPDLQSLAASLDHFPSIELERIDWYNETTGTRLELLARTETPGQEEESFLAELQVDRRILTERMASPTTGNKTFALRRLRRSEP